jgi:DNA-binding protein HU-beta
MNKGQLVKKVNEIIQDGKTSELAVNAVLAVIRETLATGEDVVIPRFGSYKVSKRAAFGARNPSTGEPVNVPARMVVKFAAGSDLEVAINSRKA